MLPFATWAGRLGAGVTGTTGSSGSSEVIPTSVKDILNCGVSSRWLARHCRQLTSDISPPASTTIACMDQESKRFDERLNALFASKELEWRLCVAISRGLLLPTPSAGSRYSLPIPASSRRRRG